MEQENNSVKWSVLVTVFYGFCSGSMNFINKFVLSVWGFHAPTTIMFSQMVLLALALHTLKKFGKISLVNYDQERARTFLPLTVIYSVNSVISLSALTGLNIPMYNAIRRCVPIASLILGLCLLRKQKPSMNIVISIMMITVGTFVAAAGDLDFDVKSYVYGIASVMSQALYLNTLQRLEMDTSLGALSISYINSINSLPVMCAMVFLTGEIRSVVLYPHWLSPAFLLTFVALVMYGCMFTYSMFLCTTCTSALTTSLVGVAKSAITTTVGMYAFGGVIATKMMICGQSVNFLGATFYAYEKYMLSIAKNKKPPVRVDSAALELGHDLKSDSDLIKYAVDHETKDNTRSRN